MARSRKRIGTLSAVLSVQHNAFLRDMKKAAGAVTSFATGAIGMASRALGKFGAIGAAVAGGGLTLLVKNSFEAIDALAKAADRFDVSTESLKIMQTTAELAGLSIEDFNKATEVMLKNIGDAAFERGTATDFLKAMNLEAEQLAKLPLEDQFQAILKGLGRIDTAAGRISAARAIAGRGGTGFLNIDPNEIDRVSKLLRGAGTLISRFDATKIELANDSITEMRRLIGGMVDVLAVKVAPAVGAFAITVRDHIGDIGNAISDWLDAAQRQARVVLGIIEPIVDRIGSLAKLGTGSIVDPVSSGVNAAERRIAELERRRRAIFDDPSRAIGASLTFAEKSELDQIAATIKRLREAQDAIQFSAPEDKPFDFSKVFGDALKKFNDTIRDMRIKARRGFGDVGDISLSHRDTMSFGTSTLGDLGFGGLTRVPRGGPTRAIENTVELGKQAVRLLQTIARNTGADGTDLAD